MNSTEIGLRGFACPLEALDLGAFAASSQAWSGRLAAFFLKSFRPQLAAGGAGLEAVFEHFCAEPGDLEATWHPSIGLLKLSLLERLHDRHQALLAAAAFALHLAEQGRASRWRLDLERPERLAFAHYVLPHCSSLAIESDGRTARICLEDRGGLELVMHAHDRGQWRAEADGTVAEPLLRVAIGDRQVTLLEALPAAVALPSGFTGATPAEPTRRAYEAAGQLIARLGGPYLLWVSRAVIAMLPLRSPPGKTTSTSFRHLPRVIGISSEARTIELAELMVHEATHHYYHLLVQVLGPVDDASDDRLYYSPPVRTHRPIDKILIAYHAFANVLLFYRLCKAGGFCDPDDYLVQEQLLGGWLDELRKPLEATRALTPWGRALFEPLAARLVATGPG